MGNGSTAAAEVVIKEGITKEMLVTTSFFYRRERDRCVNPSLLGA